MTEVRCAACDVALKGPAEPTLNAVYSCPSCGISETFEAIKAELQEYVKDQGARHIQKKMQDATKGSKFLKVNITPIPIRKYRFIIDTNLD